MTFAQVGQAGFDALKHLTLDEPDEDLLADATRDCEGKLTGVSFSWKKRGNKKHAGWDNTVLGWIEIDGARLIAEVNSKARADAIRKKIEKALGAGARYRASEIQSMEKMLADRREAGGARGGAAFEESERLAQLPEVRKKISEMMATHWEHWVSQPLPILGNRTPMDAVKDPDGREIVESLVIQAERNGRRPDLQTDENVFRCRPSCSLFVRILPFRRLPCDSIVLSQPIVEALLVDRPPARPSLPRSR